MPAINIDLLKDVEELSAIGVGYDRLIAMVQERHHERARETFRKLHGLEEWEPVSDLQCPMPRGASVRTIARLIARLKERWSREEVEMRPQRRQELRQKIQATFLKAYGEGGPSMGAAVRCLALQAKVDGLEAPQKIEAMVGHVDIKAMSPDQRRDRVAELWALRQKAIAEGKIKGIIDAASTPKKLKAALEKPKKTPAKKKAKAKKKAPARARRKTTK